MAIASFGSSRKGLPYPVLCCRMPLVPDRQTQSGQWANRENIPARSVVELTGPQHFEGIGTVLDGPQLEIAVLDFKALLFHSASGDPPMPMLSTSPGTFFCGATLAAAPKGR